MHTHSYGEIGETVINSAMECKYPDWDLERFQKHFAPLTPKAFRELVVGPTFAMMTMLRTWDWTRANKAYQLMKASTDYGYSIFQYEDGCPLYPKAAEIVRANNLVLHEARVDFYSVSCDRTMYSYTLL